MNKLFYFQGFAILLTIALSSCASYSTINISPGEEFVLGEQENSSYRLDLRNLSSETINVKTIEKTNGEQMQGFGLGSRSKTKLRIGRQEAAVISNPSKKAIKVRAKLTKSVEGMRYQPIPDIDSPR